MGEDGGVTALRSRRLMPGYQTSARQMKNLLRTHSSPPPAASKPAMPAFMSPIHALHSRSTKEVRIGLVGWCRKVWVCVWGGGGTVLPRTCSWTHM